MSKFPIENIPDSDLVYRNAKDTFLNEDGSINPRVFYDFKTKGVKTSIAWAKYCNNPEDSPLSQDEPERYGVFKLNVGRIREIEGQQVIHDPSKYQAHSLIDGKKDEEVLTALLEIAGEPVIPIPPKIKS